MEVRLARTAGFCMGVRRAMDKALEMAEHSPRAVYTYGPLIHNRQAVEMLQSKGVDDLAVHPEATGGTVLIRAHGVPQEQEDGLQERGFDVVDATCPHVVASQRQIERYSGQGYSIVIAGDHDHAEVTGLVSRAADNATVIATLDEARRVHVAEPVCLLAQTTFNEEEYQAIADVLRERFDDITVLDSICSATRERQEEVLQLAAEVEAMVVVGGRNSANTRRLAEIARQKGIPAYHVETADDLDVGALSSCQVVGLTAGASTPNWVTRSVLQALEDIGRPIPHTDWLPWKTLAVIVRSNVYSAVAASALTYACSRLLGIAQPRPYLLFAAFCYVFAVITLNRVIQGAAKESHFPPRVAFFRRHSRSLLTLSVLLAGASMWAFWRRSAWWAMAMLALAYLLGVAYSVRLVPRTWLSRVRYARLKDLPASKDLFVSLAWMFVCVLVPWLDQQDGVLTPALLPACLLAFILTAVKSVVLDLVDMQEDHLLGRETLPIVLGVPRTQRLLVVLSSVLAVVLAASLLLGWVTSLAAVLLICPAYALAYLLGWLRPVMASDVLCTLVTDGALILAGVLAFVWPLP